MSVLVILGLIVAVALLWRRVGELALRVEQLERPGRPASVDALFEENRPIEPARYAPAAEAAPEPPAAPFAPVPASPPAFAHPPAQPEAMAKDIAQDTGAIAPAPSTRVGFEELFGRRLPIWAGGLTLAIAGLMIVRYSIAAGLLSPAVRVILGLLFGGGLIAAAEAALRGRVAATDARVPKALAGAGVASLFGAILAAANLYGLIGPATAFVGLAGVTVLAGALSLRFGAPSAVLGLVGGLGAPALIGTGAPQVPLLAAYLALTVGGLCGLARGRGWWWLGAAAVAGGFGWGAILLAGRVFALADTLALGGYTLLLAAGLPLLLIGDQARLVRGAAVLAGCAQLAALVATGGFAMLNWGLFGLLAAASVWLSRRDTTLAELPAAALAVALLLAAAWPAPSPTGLAVVLTGAALIFGAPALARLWRAEGRISDAGQIAALALAVGLLPVLHFARADHPWLGLPALVAAGAAAGAAALGWRIEGRQVDARFATVAVAAALLLVVTAALMLPLWLLSPAIAAVAVLLLLVGRSRNDDRLAAAAALFGTVAAAFALQSTTELRRAMGIGMGAGWQGGVSWGIPALAAVGFARWSKPRVTRTAQVIAVLLGYGAAAQLVPLPWLPLIPALALASIAVSRRRAAEPALIAAAAIALGWAIAPLGQWLAGAGGALVGKPLLLTALPDLAEVLRRIAAPALVLGLVASRAPIDRRWRDRAWTVAAVLATVALHVAYKQLFAIDGAQAFARRGMAERTVWEMLLAAGAWLAWRRGAVRLAIGAGAASLAHLGWFTLCLHDPLWTAQASGPWPFLAFATALAMVVGSARLLPERARERDWATMALIGWFACVALHQITGGEPFPATGPGEDIGRSVLAVALSLGFLRWGIARARRDWRIASLLLMLGAIAKVFLHDAAGLDGLARIGSFAALGFSLIGIGWLYSRYLPDAGDGDPPAVNPQPLSAHSGE